MPNANDQVPDARPRTSSARGRAVRSRLLGSAAELIAEIGWNAVTTRRLAAHAGIRSGLVHYHFDSLQDLLRQAAMGRISRILEETGSQLEEGADVAGATETLLSLVDVLDGTDSTSLLVIEAYLAATRDPQLKEQLNEELARLRRTLTAALDRAGNPAPGATALLVLAALDGLVLHKGLDPELPSDEALALVRGIILTRPEAGP